jgi:hypothetical protein
VVKGTVCTDCPEGKHDDGTNNDCQACLKGQYSAVGVTACQV